MRYNQLDSWPAEHGGILRQCDTSYLEILKRTVTVQLRRGAPPTGHHRPRVRLLRGIPAPRPLCPCQALASASSVLIPVDPTARRPALTWWTWHTSDPLRCGLLRTRVPVRLDTEWPALRTIPGSDRSSTHLPKRVRDLLESRRSLGPQAEEGQPAGALGAKAAESPARGAGAGPGYSR